MSSFCVGSPRTDRAGFPSLLTWFAALAAAIPATASTTTELQSSVNPSTGGSSVVFSALVVNPNLGAVVFGTVQYFDNFNGVTTTLTDCVTGLQTLPVGISGGTPYSNMGTASLTTAALLPGIHSITAVYGGADSADGSTSNAVSQVVTTVSSTSTVNTNGVSSIAFGQPLSIAATITASNIGPTPSGTVTLFDGTTALGQALAASFSYLGSGASWQGYATFGNQWLAAGAHSFTVKYSGDANYAASTSAPFVVTVVGSSLPATSLSVTSSQSPSAAGMSITLTAKVTGNSPSGYVGFWDGSTPLLGGTVQGGTATYALATLTPGTHVLTAVYGGDSQNAPSWSMLSQVITGRFASATAVAATPVYLGVATAPLSASVSGGSEAAIVAPTGSVQYTLDSAWDLGIGSLTNAATSEGMPLPALSVGTHTILATYLGDGNYGSSTATTLLTVLPIPNVITTVAGTGSAGYSGDGTAATSALLNKPIGLAFNPAGDLVFSDNGNGRLREVFGLPSTVSSSTPPNELLATGIMTIAGTGTTGYSGDGGPATGASVNSPAAPTYDVYGNLYIPDQSNNVIRKVTPNGVISTVAGNGVAGYVDGVVATQAELNNPGSVVRDGTGNLYIADQNNNVIRVVTPAGLISTLSPSGLVLATPRRVAIFNNNLYIANSGANEILVVSRGSDNLFGDGTVSLVASGFNAPRGMAWDASGNLYVADTGHNRIVEVINGALTTVVGNGTAGFVDGVVATGAELSAPRDVAFDSLGNLYIADYGNNAIRMVTPQNGSIASGTISTVAGNGASPAGYGGDGTSGTTAAIAAPAGIALDAAGNLYVSDNGNHRVRELLGIGVGVQNGVFASGLGGSALITVAGNGTSGDTLGVATQSELSAPEGLAFGGGSNLFVSDPAFLREISNADALTATVGVSPSQAAGIATFQGTVYVPNPGGNLIRAVTSTNNTVVAGTGTAGFLDGPALSAQFKTPSWAVTDLQGNVYVADSGNNCIRELTISTSTVTTVAGRCATPGAYAGDGGSATAASLNAPHGLAFDGSGNLYIADTGNNRIRIVSPGSNGYANGTIGTVAGNGTAGSSGDGSGALDAELNAPLGIALDSVGNLFLADTGNSKIREVFNVMPTVVPISPGTTVNATPTDPTTGLPVVTLVLQNVTAAGQVSVTTGVSEATPVPSQPGMTPVTFTVSTTATFGNGYAYVDLSLLGALCGYSPLAIYQYVGGTWQEQGSNSCNGNQLVIPFNSASSATFAILATSSPANPNSTNVGANVTVSPTDSTTGLTQAATITFANVTAAGLTTVTTGITAPAIPSMTSPCTPAVAVNVSTSAVFSGSATVCLNPTQLSSTCSGNANLYHYSGGAWQLLPAPSNPPTGDVCGVTTSLSPFAILITQSTQTISFNSIGTQGLSSSPVTITATASSGLPVLFTSRTTSVCTVAGSTVTLLTTGTCSIAADQSGNANYAAATEVVQSFSVETSQSITFPPISAQTGTNGTLALAATDSAGLTISLSSLTPAVCTLSGNVVSVVSAGTCTIAANQSGNTTYAPAAQVTESFAVPVQQTISFPTISSVSLTSGTVTSSATATSGLAVTLSSQSPGTCSISGTTIALLATGVCTVAANQSGDATYAAAPVVMQMFSITSGSGTGGGGTGNGGTPTNVPIPLWALISFGISLAAAAHRRLRPARHASR